MRIHGGHVLGAAPGRLDVYPPRAIAARPTPQESMLLLQRIQAMSGLTGIWVPQPANAYSDSAGTTAAVKDGVAALLLDQAQGAVVGGDILASNTLTVESTGGKSVDAAATGAVGGYYVVSAKISGSFVGAIRVRTDAGIFRGCDVLDWSAPGEYSRVVLCGPTATAGFLVYASNWAGSANCVFSVRRIAGCHALQPTTALKPILRQAPITGVWWLDPPADGALTVTLPSAVSAATCFNVTPTGVVKTTGVNLGSSFNLVAPYTYFGGAIYIDEAVHGPVTPLEDAAIRRYLGQFVPTLGANLVVNGGFDIDVAGWTVNPTFTCDISWSSGAMRITSTTKAYPIVYQQWVPVSGKQYACGTTKLSYYNSSSWSFCLSDVPNFATSITTIARNAAIGSYQSAFVAANNCKYVGCVGPAVLSAGDWVEVDDIWIKEIL